MSEITSQSPAPLPPEQLKLSPGYGAPGYSPYAERKLRIWPGVVIVALMWAAVLGAGWMWPGTARQVTFMMFSPIIAGGLFALWWLLFSRVSWADRLLGLAVFVAVGVATLPFFDPSMPKLQALLVYSLPRALTAWVVWLLLTPFLSVPVRRVGWLLAVVLAFGYPMLLRLDGIDGSFNLDTSWRWELTDEEKHQREMADVTPGKASELRGETLKIQPGDWPGFRGPNRDSRVTGVRIATDWQENPPAELWRRRVGPGWSSFTVVGKRLYTQEQLGDDEAVTCYHTDTGDLLWVHKYEDRFTELVAGPGPRATPTFHEGKLYAQGAAGRLMCLDAATGTELWHRDIKKDAGAKTPQWGFSSSPLVADGVVSVFAGGEQGKSVLGYPLSGGKPKWTAGEGQQSYCSPHLARLGGVDQLLICTDTGLTSIHPSAGNVLWTHEWSSTGLGARVIQPTLVDKGDVLIGTGMSMGTRRVSISRQGKKWAGKEVWTVTDYKPYFNDQVVYKDHIYGYDGTLLTCIGLEDGQRKWRARGYDNGQILLLADQGLLLVLTEKGAVALLEATPDGRRELGRFQALTGKKTWNHPVIAHGKLFVRNGKEMACYELKEIKGSK
jgi:outer membrane protein assembly factor BamB